MPEFTHEEAAIARELWMLRSSEPFLEGDPEAVTEVRQLEAKLNASVQEHMLPEERYGESIERLSQDE